MEDYLKTIKMANRTTKLKTVNALKEQMYHCMIKSTKTTESRPRTTGFRWRNLSSPDVIRYISFIIVIWIVFAVYSYLHNRCMLYGGSNCVHMNPFTFQNCNNDNYIF